MKKNIIALLFLLNSNITFEANDVPDYLKKTPHEAAYNQNLPKLTHCLKKNPYSINTRIAHVNDPLRRTILLWAASAPIVNPRIVSFLLKQGACITHRDSQNKNVLDYMRPKVGLLNLETTKILRQAFVQQAVNQERARIRHLNSLEMKEEEEEDNRGINRIVG